MLLATSTLAPDLLPRPAKSNPFFEHPGTQISINQSRRHFEHGITQCIIRQIGLAEPAIK